MYIPIDLPKRKPTLKPYHYDILAECKAFDHNFAIELTEIIIEAIYIYATTERYKRTNASFAWISDTLLGDDCFELHFAERYNAKGCHDDIILECWDNRTHDFSYYINLSGCACTYLIFPLNDLPDVFDIIDYVLRVDEMIATEIDMVLQAREDLVEMRALVYGEGW